MAPVENSPAGTTTRPPPARLQASTLRRKAPVQSSLPSPRAPNFVMSKSRLGKTGALIRLRISGKRISQGASACSSANPESAARAPDCEISNAPAPPATKVLIKFRRSVMLIYAGSGLFLGLCEGLHIRVHHH